MVHSGLSAVSDSEGVRKVLSRKDQLTLAFAALRVLP